MEEMLLRYIPYLELWQPFCSADWNLLCNFGRGYFKEEICKKKKKNRPVVMEEYSSYLELWQPFRSKVEPCICVILEECVLRKNSVKLF